MSLMALHPVILKRLMLVKREFKMLSKLKIPKYNDSLSLYSLSLKLMLNWVGLPQKLLKKLKINKIF